MCCLRQRTASSTRPTRHLLYIALALLAPLAGCNLVFPYAATSAQGDASPRDARPLDSSAKDASAEEKPGVADVRGGDLVQPKDVAPAERLTGDASSDQQAEAGPQGDVAVLGACAAPGVEVSWMPDMVICERFGSLVTQCEAEQACGSGWHLCTANEYLANGGGASGPVDRGWYWLAACIRVGDTLSAPDTGAICPGGCASAQLSQLFVEWSCGGGGATASTASSWSPLGVRTAGTCSRLGIDTPPWEAYWRYQPTDGALAGLVCCR